jgi:hypothetical protein
MMINERKGSGHGLVQDTILPFTWWGLRKITTNLKIANLCAKIQIWDPLNMNRIFPNRGLKGKMHINCKYMKMNSMEKYVDFEVNGEWKILLNESSHD